MKAFTIEIGVAGQATSYVYVDKPADLPKVWEVISSFFRQAATSLHCQGATLTLHHDDCDHTHGPIPFVPTGKQP